MPMERALEIRPARNVRQTWRPHLRKLGLMDRDESSADTPEEMAALIVAIARNADRTAFARLFGYYAPRLKSYLRRMRVEERLAEDLAQEVMLTVWRKAALFDPGKASAGTWIFTIARNRFIDTVRRERRPDFDPSDPMLQPEEARPADEEMAGAQIGERVREALRDLPPDQAEVVELSFLEGLPHSAISERLGIPLGTVKSRLRLAFARLRTALEDLK
ncbi:MAG: RNA polymerase subunit sigma [Parvibaculum sp.]|jgi:RNA polymerase sigma-70 factor (ECF subfamily)|nr:RNA polymerase subunit sigma [Parvibaculum sp.]MBO6668105.1 sigma-70 family RNA polymerase sigma factor [Parvibaculum sp.]MBO6692931.1 sigma-70 family RNA polymerase sigma factor [Parvibaculum sp.]MBO6715579.1 sigma-70 family RNA polymerase sigma factor [Parvibaculum sp.]HAC56793.1 RNA polymerase subunit sigma [Rhodobiaceae bacterium]|tara:strand:- start:1867 stop:2523 length:657 start_codon:yes stop_codon:yes gene_type:complete